MTERRADDATRDVEAWLKCFYMRDHLGSVFTGSVSSVTGFGMFVSLDDLYVEGLVHISELGKDYYQYDAAKHQVLAEVNAAVKRVRPAHQVGFHIEHVNSFNPIFRATRTYADLASRADFLKVVVYNNCGGERYANFIRNISSTVFRDVPKEELLRFNSHLLGYGETKVFPEPLGPVMRIFTSNGAIFFSNSFIQRTDSLPPMNLPKDSALVLTFD